ncbi:uncharacterized protein F4807DRAFT_32982 [Annulohypoxylon truncatum]|uniref:uncharacterized protein n=1 Tax=Annulohypoxylon truncatum TaxID=327061 RepID=UPI002008149B|nr:uncharacterized protein F4807DRAFT_32982 [Annulohypoxylon truncatum]KAI1211309.1 hypothetical protein F4807DRAFT_32982 [Annulohypoxylon truncatum]
MHKIPVDLTMAWYPHIPQTALFSDGIWNTISWIAFFFKLASLAFAVPVMSLILFDFCLWLWRLNQPQPKDISEPGRISRKGTERRTSLATSPNGASSTTALASGPSASQRRPVHSGHTYD